ncbi:prephenate dehydratase [Patescibacteria group bacterium]|nr:prephenate dehydratase [Patescibacteria group bacterium]
MINKTGGMHIENKKIGYFGEPGSHTENAAKGFFEQKANGGFKIDYMSFATITLLLEALLKKQIDKAVLPIENSIEGVVTLSIDELINGSGIKIENEVIVEIRHHLISVGSIKEVRKVISHPQALAQCSKFIQNLHLPLAEDRIIAAISTSAAVKEVAKRNDPKIAAIGSESALRIYKRDNCELEILAKNIQDEETNKTRFFVLGHENNPWTGKDKTSIIFGTEDKCGSLVDVLLVFKVLGINMMQISSRPSKKKLGEYIFWVDIDGHREEKTIQVAIGQIAKITTFLKILGSYPKAE